MKKLRLLAWLITLTMLCELLPFGAFAQSDVGQQLTLAAAQSLEEENGEAVASGSCGSYVRWSLSSDGTLTIYGSGAIYNYHPNEILCNLPPWWDYRESINTIILDSEISRIGDAAFYGCNIASIDIPDNIHSIGKWAFSYCTRLSSVTIPDGMTSIAWSAFSNTALTSFTIPESVTSIDGYAFSNCPLSSITIPDNVTSIGEYAFSGCSLLTHISIPKSVTAVNDNTFADCTSLTSISIPHSVTSIGSSAFRSCSSLSSVNIPNSVVSIGSFAFNHCSALTSVNIPDSVTSIESFAFANCSALTSVNIPKHVTSIGYDAFSDCFSLTSISIPDSVTSIDRDAFDLCPSLSDVYYSGSKNQWDAISISSGNDDLLNATIHFQNSNTGNDSIYSGKCGDNLTWTLSSDGVLTIDGTGEMYNFSLSSSAWSDYSDNIKTVIVNYGVTHIGDYAFNACTNLCSVTLPESVTSIGHDAFYRCDSLTSIILPESVSSIGEAAFRGCKTLTAVNIPTSITSIENYTFDNCESLATINIPKSVISIGLYAFGSCASLNSIDIPESVISIGYGAFSHCTSLTSVTIPKSIASIETYTFNNCTSLASIYIHESVTSINKEAFFECTSLSDVYYSGTKNQWNAISIDAYQNDALLNATIHYQATDPDGEKSFDFKKDKYSFLNTNTAFFNFSELPSSTVKKYYSKVTAAKGSLLHLDYNYHLSSSAQKSLTNSLSPIDKMSVELASSQKWGGSCYGMSSTMFLAYSFAERFPIRELGVSNLSSFGCPRDDSNSEDFINYYQLSQVLPTFKSYKSRRIHDCKENIQNAINTITTNLYNHTPVLIGLGDHAILLTEILDEDLLYYNISVCDPNYTSSQKLYLYKDYDSSNISISYPANSSQLDHGYNYIEYYSTVDDIDFIDSINFFGVDNISTQASLEPISSISVPTHSTAKIQYGDSSVEISNGQVLSSNGIFTSAILTSNACSEDISSPYSTVDLLFSKPSAYQPLTLSLTPDEDYSNIDLLLNDTLLSLSTSGPVSLIYNEEARTVNVTAETPTDVNVLMTQNETTTDWPWHSWAIDTTGTTEFHAELKDDGLHLSGDGIANAQYATENADTDIVDNGTIPAKANEVIIVKKDGNNQQTEIKDNTQTKPTDPDKLTVTVVDGKITAIDDVATANDTTVLDNVTEGAKITITANDKSADGKTFREWVVTPADSVTLSDASSSTSSFTMGAVSVTIKAQYDSTTPTPTPTPGGGDSGSGGGGGDGGGAAVILGLGAAAAITAGIVLTMPVDVQGRVELADHAAVPGAKVSLLKNGNVVTQTTADESGHFSLKAKRGDYELAVVYTDANGQFVQKTTRIKAPAKDFVVTF